ncbi:hypothetical protein [Calothrix sp. CCY 0018]|uniref:hypothetical protein n=1 Tax=Calothrix sp. CCY 0018 TaxID=3103864 RepID=UPI0039C675D8
MTNIERFENYINSHPNQSIWEYIQDNPDTTQFFINMTYEQLHELITEMISLFSQVISLHQENPSVRELINRLSSRLGINELEPTGEEILLLIFKLKPDLDLDFKTLGRLFNMVLQHLVC